MVSTRLRVMARGQKQPGQRFLEVESTQFEIFLEDDDLVMIKKGKGDQGGFPSQKISSPWQVCSSLGPAKETFRRNLGLVCYKVKHGKMREIVF